MDQTSSQNRRAGGVILNRKGPENVSQALSVLCGVIDDLHVLC